MAHERDTGRNQTAEELVEAKRIAALLKKGAAWTPSAVPADFTKLTHINIYGWSPEFSIDKQFQCPDCGKEEIWKAAD